MGWLKSWLRRWLGLKELEARIAALEVSQGGPSVPGAHAHGHVHRHAS